MNDQNSQFLLILCLVSNLVSIVLWGIMFIIGLVNRPGQKLVWLKSFVLQILDLGKSNLKS